MSNALALSAVTATIQYWLNSVLNDSDSPLGGVHVVARAPDLAEASGGANDNSDLIVNLFLHQVTYNSAWRNIGLPSMSGDGVTRITNQPLALDLHYLLTAYGGKDTEAEALLGTSVLMLHENPVLTRAQITHALANVPDTNPFHMILKGSGLEDQIEMIKITPATLGREELAWLWTALKADYRPTFPFQVSVVLIQPQRPTTGSLPVLSRKVVAQAGGPPAIEAVNPPKFQAAPAPGDTVTITGTSLNSVTGIVLINGHLGVTYPAFAPTTVTNTTLTFLVPEDPTRLPAGVYQLSVTGTSGTSNTLLAVIAPKITGTPTVTSNATTTVVTLTCDPQVLPQQKAALSLIGAGSPSGNSVPGILNPTLTLTFQFPLLPTGSYLARLEVDGVVSPIDVDWTAHPPKFTGPMVMV